MNDSKIPSYLAEAKPNAQRAAWYKNIAPGYAGIILWFAFWKDIVNQGGAGGGLAHGVWLPIAAVVAAALICYLLFYKIPALFGMKTGLPLYVVGAAQFGALGGIIMPGLLMGLLQFGWVAVNIATASLLLHQTLDMVPLWLIMVVWGALAVFVGLKGTQYLGKVSTFLPLIPLAVLLILLAKTCGTVADFDPAMFQNAAADAPLPAWAIFCAIVAAIVGFFATAGAAGTDFGSGARDKTDVKRGGLVGVALSMIFTGVAAAVIMAGAYGNPETAAALTANGAPMEVTNGSVMALFFGEKGGKLCMFLLALAAFPASCFSSLIACNSFKTMLPKINPALSTAVGGAVAIALAITGVTDSAPAVFGFIGASFGPVCGAMFVDYLLSGGKWTGPRAAFNPAGWLAWLFGFAVGTNLFGFVAIPAAPVCAFAVGALVYALCAKAGLQTAILPYSKK